MKKSQHINGKLLSNQIATRKKTAGLASLHENWTQTFVLRIFVGISRSCAGPFTMIVVTYHNEQATPLLSFSAGSAALTTATN